MLTEKDTETLDFERRWWKYAGAKDAALRERFGESSTRYHLRLIALIDKPAGLAYDPPLASRLQRLRAARTAARRQRRGGQIAR